MGELNEEAPTTPTGKNLSHSYFTYLLVFVLFCLVLVWFGLVVCVQTHENSTSATEALKIATNQNLSRL
jgi:hypothetical protein